MNIDLKDKTFLCSILCSSSMSRIATRPSFSLGIECISKMHRDTDVTYQGNARAVTEEQFLIGRPVVVHGNAVYEPEDEKPLLAILYLCRLGIYALWVHMQYPC